MFKRISLFSITIIFILILSLYPQSNTNTVIPTNYFGITNAVTATNDEPAILQDIRNMENRGVVSTTGMFLRAIIGFIVTLLGIYLVFIYLKKRSKKVSGSDEIINILATTPVAANRYISVVEIVDEMYLIAIADHSITLLSKIEEKETKDLIRIAYANSKNNIVEDNFKTIFDKVLGSLKLPKTKEKSPIDSTKDLKERLEKLNAKRNDKNDL